MTIEHNTSEKEIKYVPIIKEEVKSLFSDGLVL